MRRPTTPIVLFAALFVAAGGVVHVREWVDRYRHIPAAVPGSAVVRIGFPVNAAASFALAVALVVTLFVARRLATAVLACTAVFEGASLIALILSHTANLAGWMENGWTPGADATRAVELAALAALAGVAIVRRSLGDGRQPQAVNVTARPQSPATRVRRSA